MTDDKQLLNELFHRLKNIKEAEGILHIDEITTNGKHSLTFYSEITSHHAKIKDEPRFLLDDPFCISNDLVHSRRFSC